MISALMWLEQTVCQIVVIDTILALQYCHFQFNHNSSMATRRNTHPQLPLKALVKISEGFPFLAVQVIWVQKRVDEVYLRYDS